MRERFASFTHQLQSTVLTMFTFRIANGISNRLTVQPSAEILDVFPANCSVTMLCIDRTIYLERSSQGNCECLEGQPYCNPDYPRAIRRTIQHTDLPAFTVDEADFVLVDDMFSWPIPPDHELPWSKLPPRNNIEAVVRDQLSRRVASAIRADVDLRTVQSRVPNWARGILHASEWMRIMTGHVV